MKNFSLVLLLLSVVYSAQNHRFTYNYTFTPDSLAKEKTLSENMNLDITEKGSKFYSQVIAESDSIMNAEFDKQTRGNNMNINLKGISRKGVVKTVVEKSYPSFSIVLINNLGGTNYKISDDRKIIWKIEAEKKTIGKFNTQKAITNMFGRKWIAWFSTDLPFQDGPYKFHGLPGLIVKIESSNGSHTMELIGVKTLPTDFKLASSENDTFSKSVEMDHIKYKKTFQNFLKNPTSPMRAYNMGGDTKFTMTDQNGNPVDLNKKMRESEEKMKEDNKKINNVLELDLLTK